MFFAMTSRRLVAAEVSSDEKYHFLRAESLPTWRTVFSSLRVASVPSQTRPDSEKCRLPLGSMCRLYFIITDGMAEWLTQFALRVQTCIAVSTLSQAGGHRFHSRVWPATAKKVSMVSFLLGK